MCNGITLGFVELIDKFTLGCAHTSFSPNLVGNGAVGTGACTMQLWGLAEGVGISLVGLCVVAGFS